MHEAQPAGPASENCDADPAWSPDGLRLVFSKRLAFGIDTARAALFVFDLKTRRSHQVTQRSSQFNSIVVDSDPAWSPDGRTIAFARHEGPIGLNRGGLYFVDAVGSHERRAAFAPAEIGGLSWAPSGKLLAFGAGARLEIAPVGGGAARTVATSSAGAYLDPAWSPDGTAIAYVDGGIRIVSAAGGRARRITTDSRDGAPDWGRRS